MVAYSKPSFLTKEKNEEEKKKKKNLASIRSFKKLRIGTAKSSPFLNEKFKKCSRSWEARLESDDAPS